MDHFNYQNGVLYAEDVCTADIANQFGTPCYVYSRATLERHWHVFDKALGKHPHLICYAVKANSNLAVLNLLARLGSGFDIVSVGELERVLKAGGDPKKIVFSGVGKQAHEIKRALEVGVYCFNVDSEAELELINQLANELKLQAPISFRINPDVDPKTHPYISTGLKENKFGINVDLALSLYLKASQMENINIVGANCHIGSQLTELSPFMDALDSMLVLIDHLKENGITISHLNLGGGLGVKYFDETPPLPAEYANAIAEKLQGNPIKIILEPGRAIAANAGILLTRVLSLKNNFAIIDAAMNDLLRPALYQANHKVTPTKQNKPSNKSYDLVGPICETADCFGTINGFELNQNDLLAIRTAGAYAFTMSSNYNSRPRAMEVMVDKDQTFIIRKRETIEELFEHENIIY